jgi:hypothetical protein
VPAGREVVVIVIAESTVMLRFWRAVSPSLSAALTVICDVPAALGVPPISPDEASVRPAGSDPENKDHVYPPEPPVAVRVDEYAVPTVPTGSDVVVTETGGLIVSCALLLLSNGVPAEVVPAIETW